MKVLLLTLIALITLGCAILPDTPSSAKNKKDNAWEIYMEATDQLEYLNKRQTKN